MRAQQESYKTSFFASTWSCFTDPVGRNINRSRASLPHFTGPQLDNRMCLAGRHLLCCVFTAPHERFVGHLGPGSRFSRSPRGRQRETLPFIQRSHCCALRTCRTQGAGSPLAACSCGFYQRSSFIWKELHAQ